MKEMIKKIIFYVFLIVGLYFLYSPNNKTKHNTPHSATSFVYAQF